jgi:orotidine-5'-phosphate decarboxylase
MRPTLFGIGVPDVAGRSHRFTKYGSTCSAVGGELMAGDKSSVPFFRHAEKTIARERLIVALDVGNVQEAKDIVRDLGATVSFYKLGWHLLLDRDFHELLTQLKADEKDIFLDFKVFDIPETIEGAVRAACFLGAKFITVVGQREIIKAAAKARGNSYLQILVVTLLTYMNQEDLTSEYGESATLDKFIRERAKFAAQEGCGGVISSAQEVGLIRDSIDRDDFLIVTPGIRPRGASMDDQKRTATPYDAIRNGSDYLVVGRPIIRANDKKGAARDILGEMQTALDELYAESERQRIYA